MASGGPGAVQTGWRGFAELFGWIAVCTSASYCVGLLLTPTGWSTAWRYIAGLAVAGALTLTIYWLGMDAPMTVKIAFTSTLQVIGVIAAKSCLVLLVRFGQ